MLDIQMIFFWLILITSSVFSTTDQVEVQGNGKVAANLAQLTGNVLAHAAHGYSVVDATIMEFEWFMLEIFRKMGTDGLSSIMGVIPANVVSSFCIQAVTPICKKMCCRILRDSQTKAKIRLYFRPRFYSQVQQAIASSTVDDLSFLKLLDLYGRDNAIFSYYSTKPKYVLERMLRLVAQNREISLDAINQLFKVGVIDLGLLQEVLIQAVLSGNGKLIERVLQEKFINVSHNSNKLLRLAVKNNLDLVALKIIKHSSFDLIADGISMINWVAGHNQIMILGVLINLKFSRMEFDSDLVYTRLCRALLNSRSDPEKNYLRKAIFNLLDNSKFQPTYLLFPTLQMDLLEFIPDLLGHKNMKVSDTEINYLNFNKQTADEYSKRQINKGLSLWALREGRSEILNSILKEEDSADFQNEIDMKV